MLAETLSALKTPFIQFAVLFLAALAVTAAVFGILSWNSRKQGADAAARNRVKKALSRLLRQNGRLLPNPLTDNGENPYLFDFFVVDAQGIMPVRCVGWGTRVLGTLRDATWKLEDNRRSTVIDNPLLPMHRGIPDVLSRLSALGIHRVPVKPLLIFADPGDHTQIMLGTTDEVIAYEALSTHMRLRRSGPFGLPEIERIAAVMADDPIFWRIK